MSLIIFFIAASFSARNGASAPSSAAGVAHSSGISCDPSWADARNALGLARPIASATAPIGAKRRIGRLIATSVMCLFPDRRRFGRSDTLVDQLGEEGRIDQELT